MNLWSKPQFKKCSRGRSLPEKEDHISSLPDDIVLSILSSLTIKEVAATSILSRQWLKVWLDYPVLNFHTVFSDPLRVEEGERRNYVKWVNNVLRVHKGEYLKEFRIFCNLSKHNEKDIERWLGNVLAKKIENLELNFLYPSILHNDLHENYIFPYTRFVNVKSLKSLSLKGVDVTGEAVNFLLQSCPYLERLEVSGTEKLVNLVISYPTDLMLKYLQITNCYDLEVVSISNFNLVSLDMTARGDLILNDLPMLVELSISGFSDNLSHCFSQASSCHSQLESLTLVVYEPKDISRLSNLSQMTKLKKLIIEVGARENESLTELFSFINDCPNLMEFVLMVSWRLPMQSSRAICKGEKRSLKCLELFEFHGYCGCVSDVEVIMHVVENAVCLKKIIVDPYSICVIDTSNSNSDENQQEAATATVALQQFEGLRECIPQHVDLVIR